MMFARYCFNGAGDRDRTGTGLAAHGILSPRRLPIPPLRRLWVVNRYWFTVNRKEDNLSD